MAILLNSFVIPLASAMKVSLVAGGGCPELLRSRGREPSALAAMRTSGMDQIDLECRDLQKMKEHQANVNPRSSNHQVFSSSYAFRPSWNSSGLKLMRTSRIAPLVRSVIARRNDVSTKTYWGKKFSPLNILGKSIFPPHV